MPPRSSCADMGRQSPRRVAADILLRVFRTGEFPERAMSGPLCHRPLVMEMTYGVVKWRRALDWIVGQLAFHRPDQPTRVYVLLGLYQLFWMNDVPEYAAVDETVEAARVACGRRRAGFVNALLRAAALKRAELVAALNRRPAPVRLSHPDILVRRWTAAYGEPAALALCEWNNTRPAVTLRPNRARCDQSGLLACLRRAGINARSMAPAWPGFIELPRGHAVHDLPGYATGDFIAVDPSVTVAVGLLDPRPGENVLDACAAPGGKTCLIAERMAGRGSLVACDVSEARLERLKANLDRLQLDWVEVRHVDSSCQRAFTPGLFDRVLLDVPCTNTGVLRRRADARWRFSARNLRQIVGVQRAILDSAAEVIRPGGVMVYSTCSLEAEENEEAVRWFLARRRNFKLEQECKLLPPRLGADGAFVALLRRCY